MTAYTQPGGESKHLRQTRKVRVLKNRYRAGGPQGHFVNFAKGLLIGGLFVLFMWLNFG